MDETAVAARKAEALALLRRFFDDPDLTEAETDALFSRLTDLSPDPAITDLVFWPPADAGDLSAPEQIIEKAFSYRPILL
ncbi:MAG: bacteriocin immunity protein [Pseudorhodobacter sp.]